MIYNDGLNLYAYCSSNPVMYEDPSGYSCEPKAAAENSSGSIYSNEKIAPSKQVNGGRFGVQVPPAKYIGDKPVVGSHNATDSEKALGTGLMRQATHTEQRALTSIAFLN